MSLLFTIKAFVNSNWPGREVVVEEAPKELTEKAWTDIQQHGETDSEKEENKENLEKWRKPKIKEKEKKKNLMDLKEPMKERKDMTNPTAAFMQYTCIAPPPKSSSNNNNANSANTYERDPSSSTAMMKLEMQLNKVKLEKEEAKKLAEQYARENEE